MDINREGGSAQLLMNMRLQKDMPQKRQVNRSRLSPVKESQESKQVRVILPQNEESKQIQSIPLEELEDDDELLELKNLPVTRKEKEEYRRRQSMVSNISMISSINMSAWEEDFETEEEKRQKEIDRKRGFYLSACKLAHCDPIDTITQAITTKELVLRNRSLADEQMKALSIAMVKNTDIQTLDLGHAELTENAINYLTQMLCENVYISILNLAENTLGSSGARMICDALLTNSSIVELNLAGNGFEDTDAWHFGQVLEQNENLRHLSLRHNGFSEDGGHIIGNALGKNFSLYSLDLGWNRIRRKGALAVAKALMSNNSLQSLDISWNGFGVDGSQLMGVALRDNSGLISLDMSANRITTPALLGILRGIKENTTLETLKLGYNSLSCADALAILKVIDGNTDGSITHLDLSDIPVHSKFVDYWRDMQMRRQLLVSHGTLLKDPNSFSTEHKDTLDPVMLLFEYMKQDNLRLVDMFRKLDKDHSSDISKKELKDGLSLVNMQIDGRSLEKLMKKLDINGDGVIDYEELKQQKRENDRKISKWSRAAALTGVASETIDLLKDKVKGLLAEERKQTQPKLMALADQMSTVFRRQSSINFVFQVKS